MLGGFDFDIYRIVCVLPGLILGLSMHEYFHALVAYKCGDDNQLSLGRLTLNPLKHIDPLGFIFLILLGFGWAKPVQFNARKLKKPKRDMFLISIAGPLANISLGFVFSMITAILAVISNLSIELYENALLSATYDIMGYAAIMNILLFVFNMLPIPGFDGYHAITTFLPARIKEKLFAIEHLGFVFLIALFIWDAPFNLISKLIDIIFNGFFDLFFNIIEFVL